MDLTRSDIYFLIFGLKNETVAVNSFRGKKL